MLSDIAQEAERILSSARSRNLLLRVLGGLAIKYHCPSASHRGLQRSYPDIDVAGHKRDAMRIRQLLVDLGYEPNRRFNGLYGDKRLLFYDTQNERQVDVFLDVFEMCHKLNLKERLGMDSETIPLADLLFTKLQIVEINEKDIKDIMALMRDHRLGTEDAEETINAAYLAHLCAEDWGVYRTFTQNLEKVKYFLDRYDLDEAGRDDIRAKVATLRRMIEEAPKGVRWRARARIGDRVRWYEPVEEAVREAVKLGGNDGGAGGEGG